MKKILHFSILLLMISCNKEIPVTRAEMLSGTYTCKVDTHYWDLIPPAPTTIDSTFYKDIEVGRDHDYLLILNHKIHADSLWFKGYHAGPGGNNYFNVIYRNDTLYIKSSSGGQGGAYVAKYAGVKTK